MEFDISSLGLVMVGGLVGTAAMDGAKYIGHKLKLIGGVRMDMLGRWALGMLRGVFTYKDIHKSEKYPNENIAGWLFHYLTGAIVALGYPYFILFADGVSSANGVVSAILFGMTTSVLPWFIVYPAFGKGLFGRYAPKEAKPVLTSIVSHAFYGAGIGVVVTMI